MNAIKIVGLNCSPRENSNSHAILEVALKDLRQRAGEMADYEIIDLKDHDIQACLACDVCGKTKDTGEFIPCAINDDTAEIFDKMRAADGFLVATPVYFGLPTDLFSKFIMRTRLLRHQDFALNNKTVGIIAIAGRRSGGAETTIASSWLPFIRNGCLILGNGDRTSQFGTMAWAGARGHVLSDEWGLEQAKDTAMRVYRVARLVKSGIDAVGEPPYMTFCYKSGTRA